MTVGRLAVLVLCGTAICGCDESPTTPTVSTPVRIVPPEVFALPPGAPLEAEAPPNTARITITHIEVAAVDGTRVTPDSLQQNVPFRVSMWVFVPRGLEGPLNFDMQGSGRSSGIAVTFPAGYTRRDFLTSTTFRSAGSHPLTFEISRSFVVLAFTQITLVVT